MSDIEKEIDKYLSELKNNLICDSKLKKNIIYEIEGAIFDYAERKGIREISEVYAHFGTPEELARVYLSQIEPEKIKKAVNVRKVVILSAVIALVMLACSLLLSLLDAHKSYNSAYKDEIIEDTPIDSSYTIN